MALKLFQSKEEREQAQAARGTFTEYIARLNGDPSTTADVARAIRSGEGLAGLSERDRNRLSDEAFRSFAEAVLADDHLTEQEEASFTDLAEALGIDQVQFASTYREYLVRLVVARANDGRLNEIETSALLTKKGEVVYQELPAALMKEVTIREYRGGYSGVSFRIAKGVRYSTGGMRGRSVVVGTELQVADTGTLVVSSQRAVFLGSRKTMEFPYAKLLGLDVFTDGVRFHSSNRQQAPLFRLESGDIIAATVNAAVQRLAE